MMKNAWNRYFSRSFLQTGAALALALGFVQNGANAGLTAAPVDPDDVPYEACKNQDMAQARQTVDRLVGGKVKVGPESMMPRFSEQEQRCIEDLNLVPATGILMRGFQTLGDWNRAADFSIKVGKKLTDNIERNEKFLQEQIDCLKSVSSFNEKPSNAACVGHVLYFKNAILEGNFESRLYQVFSTKDPSALPNDKMKGINLRMMKPVFSSLEVKRDPLAQGKDYDEKKVIEKEFNRVRGRILDLYVKDQLKVIEDLKARSQGGSNYAIEQQIKDKTAELQKLGQLKEKGMDAAYSQYVSPAWSSYRDAEFDKYRTINFMAFNEKLTEFPVLRFLKQADPKPADMVEALGELMKLNEKRKAEVTGNIADLQKSMEGKAEFGSTMFKKMASLVQYPKVTESVLKENPGDCAIATALSWHEENREVPATVGQLGLMVAGAATMFGVAPEVVMAAMGSRAAILGFAALDGYYLYQYHKDRENLRSDVLSVTSTNWGDDKEYESATGHTIKELNKASADFTNFVISTPIQYLAWDVGVLNRAKKSAKAKKIAEEAEKLKQAAEKLISPSPLLRGISTPR